MLLPLQVELLVFQEESMQFFQEGCQASWMAVKLPSIQAQHLANEQEVYEEHKQITEIQKEALL